MKGKTEIINVRVESRIKEEAQAIFKQSGMNISQAVRVFLEQVIKDQGLPTYIHTQKPKKVDE